MNRSFGAIVITSMLVLPAEAQIVVDHQPARSGGPAADTDFINMFGQHVWQLVADDFTVAEPAEVRRVTAWGFYDQDKPPSQESMRIRFYDARPGDGLPGNVLCEHETWRFERIATGHIVFTGIGPHEYFYTFDLPTPVALSAGAPYWLELTQLGDASTHFRIEFSGAATERSAHLNPFVSDWTLGSSNLAFQLIAVPEPASVSFVLVAVLGAVTSRRR